jgi:hypothetical protein
LPETYEKRPEKYSMPVVEEFPKCQTISLKENGNGSNVLIQAERAKH